VSALRPEEAERYRRQMQLPGFGEAGQLRLRDAAVLVTGVGGLGGTAALYLAAAGVGRIVLARGGALRRDDLNRQVLMTDDWVGRPRVTKAREALRRLNPNVAVEAVPEYVTEENADRLLAGADLALDCAHNFDERYTLNAACVRRGVPMIEAAMDGWDAYLTTVIPGETACLACLFPPPAPPWDRRGFGVLGAVSGALACLAAVEAVKVLTGFAPPLAGRLLTMDLADVRFDSLQTRPQPGCAVCATRPLAKPPRAQRERCPTEWSRDPAPGDPGVAARLTASPSSAPRDPLAP
jgi:molybdopterin/thiamine biosynthesis adenylyltransferase